MCWVLLVLLLMVFLMRYHPLSICPLFSTNDWYGVSFNFNYTSNFENNLTKSKVYMVLTYYIGCGVFFSIWCDIPMANRHHASIMIGTIEYSDFIKIDRNLFIFLLLFRLWCLSDVGYNNCAFRNAMRVSSFCYILS